jgi:hypothetical protein
MTFKKPDIPNAVFFLVRYRPEHNHPLGVNVPGAGRESSMDF